MKLMMRIAGLCLLAGAGACETTSSSRNDAIALTSVTEQASGEDGYVLTRITAPSLPDGKCGMILWTLEGERPAPVFKFVPDSGAVISINNTQVKLKRNDAQGTYSFGVAEAQSFADNGSLYEITVAIQFGLGFEGGAYLERGLITLDTSDGWRTVTPVAGIAGCRNLSS